MARGSDELEPPPDGCAEQLHPLREVKKRRTSDSTSFDPPPPPSISMKDRRNDLCRGEKAYVKSLGEGGRSGDQMYDFVPISSTFIYRWPVEGCVSPRNPRKGGLPINANGVKSNMECHIKRGHAGLRREVHIRVELVMAKCSITQVRVLQPRKSEKDMELHKGAKIHIRPMQKTRKQASSRLSRK